MHHPKAIDKIPPEILSIIFEECLPSTVGSRVSRRWRDAAHGCPSLWREIRVSVPKADRVAESPSSRSCMVHLLKKKPLQRLSISYTSPPQTFALKDGTHPTWVSEILMPTLTKVQLSTLRLDGVHIAELGNLGKGAFNVLRSLSISMATTRSLEKKGRSMLPRKIQVLKCMPNLQTLALDSEALVYIGQNHAKVPLPWSQLKNLDDLGISEPWPRTAGNFNDYVSFLQNCLVGCSELSWCGRFDAQTTVSSVTNKVHN